MMLLILQGKSYTLLNQSLLEDEINQLFHKLNIPSEIFSFQVNGKLLTSFQNLPSDSIIRTHIPLMGGKGGYGAKLKTEGGKKVRPNDNMFSRDMSGQRVVYTTMERQYREFVQKKTEEDKRVAKEREDFKVMESTLKEGKSFMKLDKAYKKGVEETEKILESAIQIGKQKYLQKLKDKINGKNEESSKDQKVEKDSQEEKKEEKSLKREAPLREEELQKIQKKVKVTTEVVIPSQPAKPVFSSAQARFQALFKK